MLKSEDLGVSDARARADDIFGGLRITDELRED